MIWVIKKVNITLEQATKAQYYPMNYKTNDLGNKKG